MSVSVIGTYHSKFGKLDDSIYELLVKAGQGALEDSGVAAKDIDGIWIGNYSGGGFNNQEHLAPYSMNIHPDLRFTPATRVENACASGSAAIREAKLAVEAGAVKYALVIGVEKMTSLDTKGVTKALAMASCWPEEGAEGMTFPGLFAEFAKGYKAEYDIDDEELRRRFEAFCESSRNLYNSYLEPHSQKVIHALRSRNLFPSLLSQRKKRLLLNLTRCEAHRDVLLNILEP